MGNAVSCAPSIIPSTTSCSTPPPTIKILSWGGTIRVYTEPIRVAELMVENPGQFVCDPTTLQISHRITGLPADDELSPSNNHRLGGRNTNYYYFLLLPMEMLYSTLTEEEMTWLTYLGSSKSTHKYGGGGVISRILFPAAVSFICMVSNNKNDMVVVDHSYCNVLQVYDGDDDNNVVELGPKPGKSYSRQRSWRPALETIVEAS